MAKRAPQAAHPLEAALGRSDGDVWLQTTLSAHDIAARAARSWQTLSTFTPLTASPTTATTTCTPLSPAVGGTLQFLRQARYFVDISDNNAKTLLALLSFPTSTIDVASKEAALLVLAVWLRRLSQRKTLSTLEPAIVSECVSQVVTLLASTDTPNVLLPVCVLVLGAAHAALACPDSTRGECARSLCDALRNRPTDLTVAGRSSELLAGVGYVMSGVRGELLAELVQLTLTLWRRAYEHHAGNEGDINIAQRESVRPPWPPLRDGQRLCKMMEYLTSSLARQSSSHAGVTKEDIRAVFNECDAAVCAHASSNNNSAGIDDLCCAAVTAAAGILCGLLAGRLGTSAVVTAGDVVTEAQDLLLAAAGRACDFNHHPLAVHFRSTVALSLLHCDARGVSLARPDSHHHSGEALACVRTALFSDAIGTRWFHHTPSSNSAHLLQGLRQHVGDALFESTGALCRCLCKLFAAASPVDRRLTLEAVHAYVRDLHEVNCARQSSGKQRKLDDASDNDGNNSHDTHNNVFKQALDMAFLSVVAFYNGAQLDYARDPLLASQVLDALAYMEFAKLPFKPHGALITNAAANMNAAAVANFAAHMPEYKHTTHPSDGVEWKDDRVLSSRVSFFFAILSAHARLLQETTIAARIAPVMFLYLHHADEKWRSASHAMFRAIARTCDVESASSSSELKQTHIAERMAPFYIKRVLAVYPGLTLYDALVASVGVVFRSALPPGSPVAEHCVRLLVMRMQELEASTTTTTTTTNNNNKDSNEEESSKAADQLRVLLFHLVRIIDVKSLSMLLQAIGHLIENSDEAMQSASVSALYQVVAASSDYARKSHLVLWYNRLCHHLQSANGRDVVVLRSKY